MMGSRHRHSRNWVTSIQSHLPLFRAWVRQMTQDSVVTACTRQLFIWNSRTIYCNLSEHLKLRPTQHSVQNMLRELRFISIMHCFCRQNSHVIPEDEKIQNFSFFLYVPQECPIQSWQLFNIQNTQRILHWDAIWII